MIQDPARLPKLLDIGRATEKAYPAACDVQVAYNAGGTRCEPGPADRVTRGI